MRYIWRPLWPRFGFAYSNVTSVILISASVYLPDVQYTIFLGLLWLSYAIMPLLHTFFVCLGVSKAKCCLLVDVSGNILSA